MRRGEQCDQIHFFVAVTCHRGAFQYYGDNGWHVQL